MKRLLFATDFDDDAQGVFKYTMLLASKLDLTIVMFHAYGWGELLNKKESTKMGIDSLNKLKGFVEEHLLADIENVKFEYVTDGELPSDAIPKVAEDEHIDIVVMGMKRISLPLITLLGNTTLDTLFSINCGVLIVPEGFRAESIRRLGCTTNFRFRDIALLKLLLDWAPKISDQPEIHCLHVFEKDEDKNRVDKDMAVMKDIFNREGRKTVNFEIEVGRLVEKIDAFSQRNELDLLVMNSHQRTYIGKLFNQNETKKIAKDIKTPLLILKNL